MLGIGLIDKPSKIWNADETGFNMGSNKSKVIGPTRRDLGVPHISFGKQRLTVMFCGSASGQMMLPFLVYPEPKPRGYNPLNGSIDGTDLAYTKKGWMDRATFSKFIDHFDRYAGVERPVLLLFDSVSSHVDHDVFMKAKSKGIELYRILPNATHLMQPLDKGVFGPLKSKWHLTSRKYTRENPGKAIGKENFAVKLSETFLHFYKPLTVINAFKSAGIYPVDSTVITHEMLKPSLTYTDKAANECAEVENETSTSSQEESEEQKKAKGALEVFQSTLSTPVRQRYANQLEEGLDLEGQSPCFNVYKKLHDKAYPPDRGLKRRSKHTSSASTSGLDLLADAALLQLDTQQCEQSTPHDHEDSNRRIREHSDTGDVLMSPVLKESLVYPKATNSLTRARQSILDACPDHLTSPESIREFSLKQLETVKSFAEKERKAKLRYMKKSAKKEKKTVQKKRKSKVCHKIKSKTLRKITCDSDSDEALALEQDDTKPHCQACQGTEQEDEELGLERLWVQCDSCDNWVHTECLSYDVDVKASFVCPKCSKN